MWGGIKGVFSLFRNGLAAPVEQAPLKKMKAPRPPRPNIQGNPNNPGGTIVRSPRPPLDRTGDIFAKLKERFDYPETKNDLLYAMSHYPDFSRKEVGWVMSAPQEVIEKLLADIQRLKASDAASHRKERTREKEERDEQRRQDERAQQEEANRQAEAQQQFANTIAAAVAAGVASATNATARSESNMNNYVCSKCGAPVRSERSPAGGYCPAGSGWNRHVWIKV